MVTFCWLPPDRRRTSAPGAGVDLERFDGLVDLLALLAAG